MKYVVVEKKELFTKCFCFVYTTSDFNIYSVVNGSSETEDWRDRSATL